MAAVLADDDCCEGGDLNVMSEESSENCVSGVCGLCGFARAEANDHVIRWAAYIHRRGVDTDGKKKKRKNHDLMTDCVMMRCMWR